MIVIVVMDDRRSSDRGRSALELCGVLQLCRSADALQWN